MLAISVFFEDYVQVNDKTRIDVSKSFAQGTTISDITIKPSASNSAISVYNSGDSNLWFLDWAYDSAAENTVTIEATGADASTKTRTETITSVTAATDYLYSSDQDLFSIETELRDYIPDTHNSFIYAHREAQRKILDFLGQRGYRNTDGSKLLKTQLNINEDLRRWSTYEVLHMIYEDLSVLNGDRFLEKSRMYKSLKTKYQEPNLIEIDLDKDGTRQNDEIFQTRSSLLTLRGY